MGLERWWFSPGHNPELWGGPPKTMMDLTPEMSAYVEHAVAHR